MAVRLTALNDLIRDDQTIDGRWELGPRGDVRYRRRGREEAVIATGEVVATEPTGLTVQVTGHQLDQDLVGQALTLRGRWQADAQNRLTFLAERASGRYDRLILGGGWQVGPRQELLYHLRRLTGAKRPTRTLTFRGHWELAAGRQLAYVLDARSDSTFRFRGTFETGSLQPKRGQLRYQLGLEVNGRRRTRTITLFGAWKLSRDLALSFEIPSADGRLRPLTFSATYSRALLRGQGEAFVRLRRSLEETAIEGGVRVRW